MEKESYYFPHFCNARHDRKIKRLTKELGLEGYGIFFMLLEVLREQTDFKYPMQDLDLLADEFKTSEQKIRVVICNYQLFEIVSYNSKEKFFSPKLLVYLQPYFTMKEQRKQAGLKSGEARKLKALEDKSNERSFNGCSTDDERSLNENEQSKRNEIKGNTYSAFFESVWSLYPCKRGKGAIKETQIKRLYSLGYETVKKCIDRYTKTKPDWQQYQNGSTFFNSGYKDYLDENFVDSKPQQQNDGYKMVE
jgi:hypothetical protein